MTTKSACKVQIGYESGFELMPKVSRLLTWLALQGLHNGQDFSYKVLQANRTIEFEFAPHCAQIGTYLQLKFS